jgi:DNA-binding beta-propeller fold protein YncE
MKSGRSVWLTAAGFLGAAFTAIAHPSSGIVVNEQGEVFFVHSTRGVAKLDREGELTYVHQSTGGHWLCLDRQGSFSRTQPKHFHRITPGDVRPAIIFADGGAPIAVCQDGNLYYGSGWGGGHEHEPGGATVSRLSPDGTISAFAPRLKESLSMGRVGVTGLAAGPDGLLYVASATGVLKVDMEGSVTALVERPEMKDCDANPPPDGLPGFQGLDVTTNGTVYVAATGCRTVVKISPQGAVDTVLKSERPWSPTGVAIHDGNLYVLEWTNPNDNPDTGWRPRVRKLALDKTISLLVEIKEVVRRR